LFFVESFSFSSWPPGKGVSFACSTAQFGGVLARMANGSVESLVGFSFLGANRRAVGGCGSHVWIVLDEGYPTSQVSSKFKQVNVEVGHRRVDPLVGVAYFAISYLTVLLR